MTPAAIPYAEIDTVFLDVGGTLTCVDFRMVSTELARHGIECSAKTLVREEAAAKQALSDAISGRSTEGIDGARVYLSTILDRLQTRGHIDVDAARRDELISELSEWLRREDVAMSIWSDVAADVVESLAALRDSGKRLVAVSNSDGRVAERLAMAELLELLDGVIDSADVGFEKPDPRIFHHALTAFSCAPARALHVGDIHAVDVVGAANAGVHAVLMDPFDDWSPPPECHRTRSLGDLTQRLV